MASPKSMPKDAQMMAQILKGMGITEYEPRVINQMLEFAFLYVTTILHSSVLAWRIPGMGEPGGLPSMGMHRVGHD